MAIAIFVTECMICLEPIDQGPRRRRFCSTKCLREAQASDVWKAGGQWQNCLGCGASCWVNIKRIGRSQYCEPGCFNRHQKATSPGLGARKKIYKDITCPWCGKKSKVPPSSKAQFCSNVCHRKWRSHKFKAKGNPNWNGGSSSFPYHFSWADAKEIVSLRDAKMCYSPLCDGEHKVLNVHHIDYNKDNCHPANLITVCCACNGRANSDREYWNAIYTSIQALRRLCDPLFRAVMAEHDR